MWWRRIEGWNAVGKWPVKRVAEIKDHPLEPACVAEEGVAEIGTLK
jgi:hypothetical protein